jgi:hypothetical protein
MTYTVELDGRLYKADRVTVTDTATHSPVYDSGPPPDPMLWWHELPIGADVGPYKKVSDKSARYTGACLSATVTVDPLYASVMREFV